MVGALVREVFSAEPDYPVRQTIPISLRPTILVQGTPAAGVSLMMTEPKHNPTLVVKYREYDYNLYARPAVDGRFSRGIRVMPESVPHLDAAPQVFKLELHAGTPTIAATARYACFSSRAHLESWH